MELEPYMEFIKQALKSKGLNYEELAEELGMSESGVKKMMNSDDISFHRLSQICKLLNISIGQMFSAAEKKSIPVFDLTTKQQKLLLSNRSVLAVFWRFVVEGMSFDEISKAQRISSKEVNKIARKLVSHDLLYESRGKFHSPYSKKFRWSDDSLIARTLNKEWSTLTLQRSLNSPGSETNQPGVSMHRLVTTRLTEKSYADFCEKLSALLDETVRNSEREEITVPNQKLKTVSTVVATVQASPLDPCF